jgi:hypothetical protein
MRDLGLPERAEEQRRRALTESGSSAAEAFTPRASRSRR